MSARRVLAALALCLRLLWRHRFVHVYAAVGGVTVLVLLNVFDRPALGRILPVVIVYEPGMLGLILAGAYVFFERTEGSLEALRVSPLQGAEYAAALALGVSALSSISALLLQACVVGADGRALLVLLISFLMSYTSASFGLMLAARFQDLIHFLIGGAVPVALLAQCALLSHFAVVSPGWFGWLPVYSALQLIDSLAASGAEVALHVGLLVAWALGASFGARRSIAVGCFERVLPTHRGPE